MSSQAETPFDSIENAKDYVKLLQQTVADARQEIATDLAAASEGSSDRRLEALRVIHYKLEKLEQHLHNSSRALNDLRSLRRLLFDERTEPATPVRRAHKDTGAA
jgi:formiminotetrahydrofolate cyclodeaminase